MPIPPVPRIPPRVPRERCTHKRTRPGHGNPLPMIRAAAVRVDYVECLDCGTHVALTRATPLSDPPPDPT